MAIDRTFIDAGGALDFGTKKALHSLCDQIDVDVARITAIETALDGVTFNLTSVQDGDVLVYDATPGEFVNAAGAGYAN